MRREVAPSQSLHKVPLENRDRHSLLPSQVLPRVLQDSQGRQTRPRVLLGSQQIRVGYHIPMTAEPSITRTVTKSLVAIQQPTASSKHSQGLHDAKPSHATPYKHPFAIYRIKLISTYAPDVLQWLACCETYLPGKSAHPSRAPPKFVFCLMLLPGTMTLRRMAGLRGLVCAAILLTVLFGMLLTHCSLLTSPIG